MKTSVKQRKETLGDVCVCVCGLKKRKNNNNSVALGLCNCTQAAITEQSQIWVVSDVSEKSQIKSVGVEERG